MAPFFLQQQFTFYLHLGVLGAFRVREDLFTNFSTFSRKAIKSPWQCPFKQSSLSPEKGICVTWFAHCSLKIRKTFDASYPCPKTLQNITATKLSFGVFIIPTESLHIQHDELWVETVFRRFRERKTRWVLDRIIQDGRRLSDVVEVSWFSSLYFS